jgi:hypothetical protein
MKGKVELLIVIANNLVIIAMTYQAAIICPMKSELFPLPLSPHKKKKEAEKQSSTTMISLFQLLKFLIFLNAMCILIHTVPYQLREQLRKNF